MPTRLLMPAKAYRSHSVHYAAVWVRCRGEFEFAIQASDSALAGLQYGGPPDLLTLADKSRLSTRCAGNNLLVAAGYPRSNWAMPEIPNEAISERAAYWSISDIAGDVYRQRASRWHLGRCVSAKRKRKEMDIC